MSCWFNFSLKIIYARIFQLSINIINFFIYDNDCTIKIRES